VVRDRFKWDASITGMKNKCESNIEHHSTITRDAVASARKSLQKQISRQRADSRVKALSDADLDRIQEHKLRRERDMDHAASSVKGLVAQSKT
jgi:hypothetical protein